MLLYLHCLSKNHQNDHRVPWSRGKNQNHSTNGGTKKMRTIKSILFFVLQGFVYYSNAQSPAPCLEIDSIQTEYAICDVITFNFRNNCDEKVLVSVSLEKKLMIDGYYMQKTFSKYPLFVRLRML